nr:immunoglobulin light chain junction region [Macaca mulatta]MOX28082.1 immunoglobulin light chain junction region [Macaca mulatta]MOX28086.1 immunoglobulin light chain junction region [Macaca mulatta]MOX28109.1 immunoglobulin light chain junction region [Macaca mulatta]MOX28119.1 immunoglobulin light chain junction region [Macaca mulatta]
DYYCSIWHTSAYLF